MHLEIFDLILDARVAAISYATLYALSPSGRVPTLDHRDASLSGATV